MKQGFSSVADGTVPSFTCPNNMSIITGTPASKHGISGNYYLDVKTGQAVVMTGPELLRGDTILAQFANAGAQGGVDHRQGQAAPAARQEPRREPAATSASRPSMPTSARWRRTASRTCSNSSACRSPTCTRWSCRCSCSTPASSCWRWRRRDLLYLSLTDYVQHKYAPEEAEARRFYQALDQRFGRLAGAGRGGRADGRPRHERQVGRGRPAERDLAAGHPGREVRQGRLARDLPDHRRLRRAPRRARRLRARLVQGKATPQQVMDGDPRHARHRVGARQGDRLPRARPARRPRGRRGGDLRPPTSASARAPPTTTCRAWPATGCARTAACPRPRCRSS